jgi:murein DD-endopeptidase MepM/ murein hydrolase activator NlpD
MLYTILAIIFFSSLFLVLVLLLCVFLKPRVWIQNQRKIKIFYGTWFIPYFIFIFFFTGPEDISVYPAAKTSQFKLPWEKGVRRFVAQGNRSFTSHRGICLYAWDFVMPIGTEILAARGGKVVEVLDSEDGIGLVSNFIAV